MNPTHESRPANDATGSFADLGSTRALPDSTDVRHRARDGELGATVAGGRYLVLREHARGGMGVVSLARDQELWREVAFKEMKPEYVGSPTARRRFVAEGEVTGRLEHPGIVPIYGLGEFPDGRPFYAMRFIQGESLREALRTFHERPGAHFLGLEFRGLLKRFVDTCNAVGFAHSRGIIHRDLKPANVMLGPFGETLVVDWGLAKDVQNAEIVGSPTSSNELTNSGLARESTPVGRAETTIQADQQTEIGHVVGTPAYMAPEQADGRWDLVCPQTDVYSLGATLFELLVGRMPFQGIKREVLANVRAGRVVPPRSIRRDVPAALDSVCRKAMARCIEDRYESALALAADIEHWLADEPVRAHRDSLPARLRRWGRKHRTLVTSLFLLFVTTTLALGVSLYFVNREKNEKDEAFRLKQRALESEQQALRQTREALNAESKALTTARAALDTTTDEVVSNLLGRLPRLGRREERFLDKIIFMYRSFAADQKESPAAQAAVGGAHLRIGYMQHRLNRMDETEKSYRDAVRVLRAAIARDPQHAFQSDLARALNNLAVLLRHRGELDEAARVQHESIDIRIRLFEANPSDEDLRLDLGQSLANAAEHHRRIGDSARAESMYLAAIAMDEPRLKSGGLGPEEGFVLAQNYNNLAVVCEETGRLGDAAKHYLRSESLFAALHKRNREDVRFRHLEQATRINRALAQRRIGETASAENALLLANAELARMADEFPGMPEIRLDQARGLVVLGQLYNVLGRPKTALAELRKADVIHAALVKQFPAQRTYRDRLAVNHQELGKALAALGLDADAEKSLRRAVAIVQELADQHKERVECLPPLGNAHLELAIFLQEERRHDDAEKEYIAAIDLYDRYLRAFPNHTDSRMDLSQSQRNLLSMLTELGRLADAEGMVPAALKNADQLLALNPRGPLHRAQMGAMRTAHGYLLRVQKKNREAEAALVAGLRVFDELETEFPDVSDYPREGAAAIFQMGLLRYDAMHYDRSILELDKALAYLDRAARKRPEDRQVGALRQRYIAYAVLVHTDGGNHAQAARTALRLEMPPPPAEICYDVACFLSRCSAMVLRDPKTPEEVRKPLSLQYGATAVEFLRKAVARGLIDKQLYTREKDLDPLRFRPDFQKLIADLK